MSENNIFSILDVNVHLSSTQQVLDIVKEHLNSTDKKMYCITTINLEFIMIAQQNKKFKNYINKVSDLNTIDGVGLINVFKWYGIKNLDRVCGSDLAYKIAEICRNCNKKYFILGASESVSERAKIKLKELYPGLNIENYSPPYVKSLKFSKEEDQKIMDILKNYKPDVLCVAFGAPKQELWIDEHKDFLSEIGVKIAIGLGGSFDFISGRIKRAPEIFKKTGNEWLYRLIQEPKARFIRYAKTIPIYYILCFFEFIRKRIK